MPFKGDWRCIPNLKYLVLGLFEFKLRPLEYWDWADTIQFYDKLVNGAERMAVLELEELIVYGSEIFLPDFTGQRLKLLVGILFRPAMASRTMKVW